ncbi:MAG: hypothetical protein ACOC3I_05530 [Verrucomicrobiota bacterium]
MERLADDLWHLAFPLKRLGLDIQRHVTILSLPSGVVVHSTAPFAPAQVEAIRGLGEVRWVLDAMLDHDSYAEAGRVAFPEATFLGPPGFAERVPFPVDPLLPPPAEWTGYLEVLPIEGVPSMREHVFLHTPSRTLIVADLALHFPSPPPVFRALLSLALKGGRAPGVSRRVEAAIKDRVAFRASVKKMMQWDFDRLIVGHGTPLEAGAKSALETLFGRVGWLDR